MKKRTRLAWAGLLLAAVLAFGTGMAAAPAALANEAGVEASTAVPTGRYTGIAKITTNIHSTMNLSNTNVAGRVTKGDVVCVVKRVSSDWYQVVYRNSEGQDIKGYLQPNFLEENTNLLYATADVNLRTSYSEYSTKITTIPEKATVELISRNSKWGNWVRVNYRGNIGYASTDYVKSKEDIEKDEKKKAEEELKKLKEEIANTIDCAEIEFENISVAYDGASHSTPRVSNLPDGVEVTYSGSTGKYKTAGIFLVKASFKAEEKGKKLVNASPRVAYLRISIEKGTAVKVKGLKYEVTKASDYGFGTVKVKGAVSSKAKSVKIPEAIRIGGVRFQVTEVEKKAFAGMKNLKTAIVGNKVAVIGASAFQDCPALTNIRLGAEVKTIGEKAFFNVSSMKTLNIVTQVLKTVGKNAFAKTGDKVTAYVPGKMLTKYTTLLTGKGLSKKAKIK